MVLNGDYYSQAETLLANRDLICGAIIAAMVIFGLLVAACVVLYILAAGHDKDKEGISETIPDRMPMEVSAFVFLMIAFFPLCVVDETHAYESIIYYVALAIALVIMFVSGFLWIGTVAVNVKRGQFWKNTVLYKLFIKGMLRWGREFRFVFKNLKMGVRVWLIFAAVSFAEMFCLAWFDVAGECADIELPVFFCFQEVFFVVADDQRFLADFIHDVLFLLAEVFFSAIMDKDDDIRIFNHLLAAFDALFFD